MDFVQLCNEVIVLTHRPDLVAETQLNVRNATLYMHMKDFWMRDRLEKKILFNDPASNFMINIDDQFIRWRKFDYIRKWDNASGEAGLFIKQTSPVNMFDEYGLKKSDIYYVSGNRLNLKTSDSQTGFLVGWYTFPNVMDQFTSWIGEMFPYAIIEMAAGKILAAIGQVEAANKFIDPQKGTVFTQQIPMILTNELEPEAR